MPTISLQTKINAPLTRVFDLARCIDLHMDSTEGTNEQAVRGKTSGLIKLGESVTWRAKHLGIYQNLTVKIVEFDSPHSFTDEMQEGAFKSMRHTHSFTHQGGVTTILDEFDYKSPHGFLGKFVDLLFFGKVHDPFSSCQE